MGIILQIYFVKSVSIKIFQTIWYLLGKPMGVMSVLISMLGDNFTDMH